MRTLGIALALCACSGGGHERCLALPSAPCAIPQALHLTITSAANGGAVANPAVTFTGVMQGSAYCNTATVTTCDVLGPAGEYDLTVSAPGYATLQRVVEVPAVDPQGCGCGGAVTQNLTIALTPQP
jgi:hypothetical protein